MLAARVPVRKVGRRHRRSGGRDGREIHIDEAKMAFLDPDETATGTGPGVERGVLRQPEP